MLDPVGEFCEGISGLSDEQLYVILNHCYFLIGVERRPTGAEQGLSDLEGRMRFLTDSRTLYHSFLINGLLTHFIDEYEEKSDPSHTSSAIDDSLGIQNRLREELKKPIGERRQDLTEEQLRELLKRFEDGASRIPEGRREAEKMLAVFQRMRQEHFTRQYWDTFGREQIPTS